MHNKRKNLIVFLYCLLACTLILHIGIFGTFAFRAPSVKFETNNISDAEEELGSGRQYNEQSRL